jgi:hypothetical protein
MTGADGARFDIGERFFDMRQFYILVKSFTPCGLFRRFAD